MPVTAQYVFIVTMDVAPEKEALFLTKSTIASTCPTS
jgi:hypothetical protein